LSFVRPGGVMRVILALGSRVFPLSCGKMVSFDACYQDDGTLHSFCGACFLEKHVHLLAYSVTGTLIREQRQQTSGSFRGAKGDRADCQGRPLRPESAGRFDPEGCKARRGVTAGSRSEEAGWSVRKRASDVDPSLSRKRRRGGEFEAERIGRKSGEAAKG
jgi:hypothetical protein